MADFTTTKVNGQQLDASEWNQLADIDNAVISSDQTPATGDLNQLGKAMANYASTADFYTDSGSANIYTLTAISPFQTPSKYTNGMRVRFRPANNGTGAATVAVGVLGAKSIKKADGTSDPAAGDISTARDAILRFDLALDLFRLDITLASATETTAGIAEIATQAETNTGTDDLRFITPLKLATNSSSKKFQSSQQTITLGGQLTIPHGLSSIPTFYETYLVCTDSGGEAGYTQDQETKFNGVNGDGNYISIIPDATNLVIRIGANTLTVTSAATGTGVGITPSKWRLIFRASI